MSQTPELSAQQASIDLRAVITTFYDRVFEDMIIGYFFAGLDKQQLIDHQVAFVTQMLGFTGEPYRGKPLKLAHRPHAIRKPHFDRRQMILKEALLHHQVPKSLIDTWLAKEAKFYQQVVKS